MENFDFIKIRYAAYVLSAVMIVVGLLSIFILPGKGLNLSIQFVGGVKIQAAFKEEVKIAHLREALKPYDLDNNIQEINKKGGDKHWQFIIQSKIINNDIQSTKNKIKDALRNMTISGRPGTDLLAVPEPFPVQNSVGPSMGGSNIRAAGYLILAALILIVIYLSFRFKFVYAVAAGSALVHDVLISVGLLSLLGREIDIAVIAAILTIIGYSLNDTIVIFDRIRENINVLINEPFMKVVSISIRQTLSRTIITSLTTLMAVMALLLWGPETIATFSLTLLVGVVVGTYSSIFVASPVLVEWHNFQHGKRKPARQRSK